MTAYIGPLFSVAVGWFLHEFSDVIRQKREDRQAAGLVLAELLEIRHQYRSLPALVAEIRTRFTLPPEIATFIQTILNQILSPMFLRMEERYNKSIDLIAGRFPLLAFDLRGKDMLRQAFDQLRSLAASDPAAVAALPSVEFAITQEALPALERLLRKLAGVHGFSTWLWVRHHLKKKDQLPSELQKFLDSVMKTAGVTPPPPPSEKS